MDDGRRNHTVLLCVVSQSVVYSETEDIAFEAV